MNLAFSTYRAIEKYNNRFVVALLVVERIRFLSSVATKDICAIYDYNGVLPDTYPRNTSSWTTLQ